MLFSAPIFKRCQHCLGLIEQPSMISGNTIGARIWTDGKMDAPMLPELPQIVKCPHCSACIWLEEQSEVNLPHIGDTHDQNHAQRYWHLEFDDYMQVLKAPDLEEDKQHFLRVQAWWKGNDKRRDAKAMTALTQREQENLKELIPLLDINDPNERLMVAEINRELGLFKEAERLLPDDLNGPLVNAAWRIASLADMRDPFVREIDVEGDGR